VPDAIDVDRCHGAERHIPIALAEESAALFRPEAVGDDSRHIRVEHVFEWRPRSSMDAVQVGSCCLDGRRELNGSHVARLHFHLRRPRGIAGCPVHDESEETDIGLIDEGIAGAGAFLDSDHSEEAAGVVSECAVDRRPLRRSCQR